jgi:hypothetical protein
MPNWCVNQLDVVGEEADIEKLVNFVKGDGDNDAEVFDFRKIVPPPDSEFYSVGEGQNNFQCGCKPVWHETSPCVGEPFTDGFVPPKGDWRVDGKPIARRDVSGKVVKDLVDILGGFGEEVCPIHEQPKFTKHPDWWYNWNVANWGTKWNCGEVWHDRTDDSNIVEVGRTSYGFDTAWAPASPVIAALAEKFPSLSITHRYCEGGMGYAGQAVYLNGKEVSRDEYDDGGSLPDEAYFPDEDGKRGYERDYDKVPMNAFESFCDEYFGGVVGG